MDNFDNILAKSGDNGQITLVQHLSEVSTLAEKIALNLNLDITIARRGAVLHDIGKVCPVFQQTLKKDFLRPPGFVFRHEIPSLFFISLLNENEKHATIEMIVAHHKSIYKDAGEKGILDLVENDPDCFNRHIKDFEFWSKDALSILEHFEFTIKPISVEDARFNFYEVIDYCESRSYGYSLWKGVLTAADHLASAMNGSAMQLEKKLFIAPDLRYYHSRKSEMYPLSLISVENTSKHTLVTAPTGAGKTDFLIRRCTGRIFYTLPFQASINAMYERIKKDLKDTDTDIRLLHAASSIKLKKGQIEEKILQHHVGASIKVLTPHQIASIVFGTKGFEAMIVDLKGCDIILDEIHTYSDTVQAIVLKIVEILCYLGCRVHIGTATMPTVLYNRLIEILGGKNNVFEVKLSDDTLDAFNRHLIYKVGSFETLSDIIDDAIVQKQKILIVCNQVKRAQSLYESVREKYPHINKMLVHSKFKRGVRNKLETDLQDIYNKSYEACLVVSTQIVEVSLDISFDIMITECAPIDSLIQRFGRINRKRSKETIGHYKPVYILVPPTSETEAKPYKLEILQRTFDALPDKDLLKEKNSQQLIDKVYPTIDFLEILNEVFRDGKWRIKELWHNSKSALLEALDIDSVTCIVESDKDKYYSANYENQVELEIPVSYNAIAHKNLDKLEIGSKPFVIPSKAYNSDLGYLKEYAKPEFYDKTQQFL